MGCLELPEVSEENYQRLLATLIKIRMGVIPEPHFGFGDDRLPVQNRSDDAIREYFDACARLYSSPESYPGRSEPHMAAMYFEAKRRNEQRERLNRAHQEENHAGAHP